MDKLDVKVTRLGDGWGIRLFDDGKLHSEAKVFNRVDIGSACRYLMRWYDKLGGTSARASRTRKRMYEKPNYDSSYERVQNVR